MPDTRGYIVIGLFVETTLIFAMIFLKPELASVQLFGALATVVISGGLGGAVGFYLGASKAGTDNAATIAKQLNKATAP